MPIEYDFNPGLDLTAPSNISASMIHQAIAQILPKDIRGGVITQDHTPDTVEMPHLKRYLWIRPSENYKIVRRFNTTKNSWDPIGFGEGSVNGSVIENGSITLDKLAPSTSNPEPGKALWLIRINAAGDGLEFWPLTYTTNTIKLNALKWDPQLDRSKVLQVASDGTTIRWSVIDIDTIAADHTIDINKLTTGEPNEFLTTTQNGVALDWRKFSPSIDLSNGSVAPEKLIPGSEGQRLVTRGSKAVWSGGGVLGSYARMHDEKPPGTSGGGIPDATKLLVTRELGTAPVINQSSIITNFDAELRRFRLATGSYYIRATVPAGSCASHVGMLSSVVGEGDETVATTVILGTMEYSVAEDNKYWATTRSEISGIFSSNGNTDYEIRHHLLNGGSTSLGLAGRDLTRIPPFDYPCIFTIVEIWRLE